MSAVGDNDIVRLTYLAIASWIVVIVLAVLT